MKEALFLFLLLFSQMAFSFETGEYHGRNKEGTQFCDLELVQNAASIVLQRRWCRTANTGYGSSKKEELRFGHSEKREGSALFKFDVSADQVRINWVDSQINSSLNEVITRIDEGKISYQFSFKDIYGPTQFDIELTKQ